LGIADRERSGDATLTTEGDVGPEGALHMKDSRRSCEMKLWRIGGFSNQNSQNSTSILQLLSSEQKLG